MNRGGAVVARPDQTRDLRPAAFEERAEHVNAEEAGRTGE